MPSLWGSLSFTSSSPSPSPSSSSSSSDWALKGKSKGKSKSSNDIIKNAARNEHRRKLTRVRKLRHATDEEVGINSDCGGRIPEGPMSLPASPNFGSGSSPGSGAPTPHHAANMGLHWSKSAVPQPLPRPEVSNQGKQTVGSQSQRVEETRNSSYKNFLKTTDDIIQKTKMISAYRRRGFRLDLNVDTSEHEVQLHFPARSAPSSGCSSPVMSSQRYSTVDLFHPSLQISSPFGASSSDRISKSYQISPVFTPDHSPLHSPTPRSPTKYGNSRNNNPPLIIHSHNKSLQESSAVKYDANNFNVHPLPRPPAVSRPSPTSRHSNDDKSTIPPVKDQWQRGKLIGRGTYGSVYIATHRETGATCAMKEVELILDDPKCVESVKQLEQEIKFLGEFKHRNIVQYYGCEKIDDRFCIYLEYVHPGSISKYVQEHCGTMTESIVRNFTRHILSGLAYLHNKKTIHRDIKGANLLVDSHGTVKLADFGLAKHLVGSEIELSLKGTPHWIAPEVLQAAMRKDANPELAYGVDIWSVGCTVIEMLTGKPPWSDCSAAQAMFSILNKSPAIPETLSAEGKDFLQQCFQKRPEDRPSAYKLLEHPFLRSSQDQNTAGLVQQFSGIKLDDLKNSSNWIRRQKDHVMLHSSATRIQQGKLPLINCETSRQATPEPSESGASTSHHSPLSILEILPRVTSPEFHCSSNGSSPSNLPNNLPRSVVNNNIYSFSCKGNINRLMPKITERKKEDCNVQQEIN